MQKTMGSRARPAGFALIAAVVALVAGACIPPPDPAPKKIDFDSAATSDVTFEIPDPNDPEAPPIVLTPTLPGHAAGTWSLKTGALSADLTFDDGIIDVSANGMTIPIGYTAATAAPAEGTFDPQTGAGSLSTDVILTVTTVDLGGGANPMEQPCALTLGLELDGAIDLDTGMLEVTQDGLGVTPPAEVECGGLGGVIGMLLGGPVNSYTLGFEVGTV